MSRLRCCFSFKGCITRKQFIIGCICTCGIVLLASYIFNNLVYCAIALISLIAFSSFAVRRMHDIHKPVKIFVAVIVIFVSMSAVSAYYKNQGINYFITSTQITKNADSLSSKNSASKPNKLDAAVFENLSKGKELNKKANIMLQKSKDYMLTADMVRYPAIALITISCVLLASIKNFQENNFGENFLTLALHYSKISKYRSMSLYEAKKFLFNGNYGYINDIIYSDIKYQLKDYKKLKFSIENDKMTYENLALLLITNSNFAYR